MKFNRKTSLVLFLLLGFLFPLIAAAVDLDSLPPKLQEDAHKIELWGKDAGFIKDVSSQNAQTMSTEEIMAIDKEWIASKTENERMKALMNNGCAKRLAEYAKTLEVVEAMVMDDRGTLVCMTRGTSDYWQGDEPKWQQAYLAGKGHLFVEKAEYDESTKSTIIHISVPVMDGEKAIGVITVGLKRPQGFSH